VVKRPATVRVSCLAAGMVALSPAAVRAALPPYWQSAREITAIVSDSRVHDALKYEEAITSVTSVGNDQYEVKTERCTVQVTIVTAPQAEPIAGPRQFDIEVGAANCR
jgi:hypothetical protein